MRKIYIILLFVLLFSVKMNAQSLIIYGTSTDTTLIGYIYGPGDYSDMTLHSNCKNISNKDISLRIRIDVEQKAEGHSFNMCWAGGCTPIVSSEWNESKTTLINANSLLDENAFYSHYYPFTDGDLEHPIPGKSILRFVFYDESNPKDSAVLRITYIFSKFNSVDNTDDHSVISVCKLDNDFVEVNSKSTENKRLILFDMLGNQIKNINFTNHLLTDLSDCSIGAFFFTVVSENGKILSKGKFIK